jgi:AbrB family looped-hinge helix DNA binding protein
MSESQESIIRYHAKVTSGGRIIIPDITRRILGIKKGNIVKLKVSKVDSVKEKEKRVIIRTGPEVIFEAKVGSRGLITIPDKARELLKISDGDYVEVELLDYKPATLGLIEFLRT